MKVKELFLRTILLVFGLISGILLFEAYLRITNQGVPGFFRPDPYLGSFHIPHMEGVWRKACFSTTVKFNSRGLRDVERPLQKARGVYRVVVLGDSFTEGLQVELEETFPQVLESLLNAANLGKRFEVVNLGTSAFGTDQEYLSLEHYGLQYDPDLVVLALVTGNDIRNNSHILERQVSNTPKPFFAFNEDGNLIRIADPPRSAVWGGWFRGIGAHFRIYGWLRERIYATPFLHRLFWRLGLVTTVPPKEGESAEGGKNGAKVPLDLQVYLVDYPPVWEEAWRITKALILRTKEVADRHGSRFLLVSLSDGIQLADPSRLRKELPAIEHVRYNLDRPIEILDKFSRSASINYLPLLPIFRSHLRQTDRPLEDIHYWCDGHWTPLGHSLAAHALFKKIVTDRLYERES